MKYKTNPNRIKGICKLIPENKADVVVLLELVWRLKNIDNNSCEIIADNKFNMKCVYLYRIDK